ncbi:hypothetical protein [Leptolyngbya ohadii]|uniref:hypothetical protein n=1 Tax=Leptolyngbya ohadii TaxID=1962290 RepID=UPI000B5A0F47|nr:hypothetical protein [Leptolyngbya ohadii]
MPSNPLHHIHPAILATFTPDQFEAVKEAFELATKPAPKLVDLRFVVDLIFDRYFVVLLVGKDRRQSRRAYLPERMSRVGNTIAAVLLLVGLNLLITLVIALLAYLVKSAIGIDVFPDAHLADQLEKF